MRLIKDTYQFYFYHPATFVIIGWLDSNGIKGYCNDIGEDIGYNTFENDKVKAYCI